MVCSRDEQGHKVPLRKAVYILIAIKTFPSEVSGPDAVVEAGRVTGMLPSWCWRASFYRRELVPIRTKIQLNYFSYTGIISISFSHLILSPLFCVACICPDYFVLVQEFDG